MIYVKITLSERVFFLVLKYIYIFQITDLLFKTTEEQNCIIEICQYQITKQITKHIMSKSK